MDGFLKLSTAHTFQMGPFIDDTDGKTAETGLTIAYTDVFLSKQGAAFAAKGDTTNLTGTGDARGYYDCVLNTTDTNTVGTLKVCAHIAGLFRFGIPSMSSLPWCMTPSARQREPITST